MKKVIYFIAALVLFSCETSEELGMGTQGGAASDALPEVLYATIADNGRENNNTRTVVAEDGKTILWNSGDAITYIGPSTFRAKYQYEGDDRVASAMFTYQNDVDHPTDAVTSETPFAVYPYYCGAYCKKVNGVNALAVEFPMEQTYASNSFGRDANVMVAVGEDSNDIDFYFRNACGYLVIKLYGEDVNVKKIELTALGGEKISGMGYITASRGAAPTIAMETYADSTVVLNCGEGVALGADAEHATEFWFALPPTSFSKGFKIHVMPTTGLAFEMQTSRKVEITRNDIQPMAALQFVHNAQSPSQLIYTRSDDSTEPITFHNKVGDNPFDAAITKHYYDGKTGKFIIECGAPILDIKGYAFSETGIGSVSLPGLLRTIGEYAFSDTDITEFVIPSMVTTLGRNAFSGCTALQTVTFQSSSTPLAIGGEGETHYGMEESPFYQATLQTLVLNRKLVPANEKVSMTLFRQHRELTSVTIGDEVESIDGYMFSETGITSLSLPASITSIKESAFADCNELATVDVKGKVSLEDGAFSACGKLETVNIRGGVTGIGIAAFQSCTSLRSFSVENAQSTGEIGRSAFLGCEALTAITIPGGISSIGDKAFKDCTSLSSVSFLAGQQPLAMGYIPGMIAQYTSDHGPFYFCPLTSINLNRNIVMTTEYADDCDTVDEGIFSYQGYKEETHHTTLTIGSNVTSLPTYMFATSGVTTVTIPASVTSVGNNVFKDCDKLQSAIINPSVIGSNMFDDCDNLATVTIAGTLNAINVDAFTGCSKLSTLNISGSVGSISDGAFDGFNLTSLNISGHVGTIGAKAFDDNDKMTSFTVTSTGSIGTIGDYAFNDCDALETVDIRGAVDRVCSYAFSDCDQVTTLGIRANVVEDYAYDDMDGLLSATLYGTTVGKGVFYDCNALQTVVIDGGVNSVGDDAFYNCNNLSSVTFNESANKLIIGYQPSNTDDLGPFYQSPLAAINLYREIEPSATYKEQLDDWDMGIFANSYYNKDYLTANVILGSNVKTIWPWMFSCVRMQNIEIPASVTSIGNEAFSYCYILEEVFCKGTIAPTLGSNAFEDCNKLNSIAVPKGSMWDYQSRWSQYNGYLYEK